MNQELVHVVLVVEGVEDGDGDEDDLFEAADIAERDQHVGVRARDRVGDPRVAVHDVQVWPAARVRLRRRARSLP